MLKPSDAVLVIVDVQEKLMPAMHDAATMLGNLCRLIGGIRVLGMPILWLEQNPRGLGATVPEVAALMEGLDPIAKMSFSCCGAERFMRDLSGLRRQQVLVAGIESHVCVYQTAVDLASRGYEVEVVSDAVTSRTVENRNIGLQKMRDCGVRATGVEMALFELLRTAGGPEFRRIADMIK